VNTDLERIFSSLDDVAWGKLQHAYGSAADVPALIRALTSPDTSARNDAWYELHGNLWHQGTIYEATAPAVPILLQLLQAQAVPDKYQIIIYLARLFSGRSYWDAHKDLKTSRYEVSKPDFQGTLRRELSCVEATKDAIRAGNRTYMQLLRAEEVGLRIAAAYLLGLIGESENAVLEAITESSERLGDPARS